MSRLKRTSTVLEAARQRLAGFKSITTEPNFGGDLTVASYEGEINGLAADIDSYNQMLSDVDVVKNRIEAKERSLRDKSARILAATGAKFGPDSDEYERVGGTRRSERKRPGPRKPSGPAGKPTT